MSVSKKERILLIGGAIILCCIILIVALAVTLSPKGNESHTAASLRIDCAPAQPTISGGKCRERGCRFDDSVKPFCYFPSVSEGGAYGSGYDVIGCVPNIDETFLLKLKNRGAKHSDTPIQNLNAYFNFLSENILQIKISANEKRYEVPVPIMINRTVEFKKPNAYGVKINNKNPFAFQVYRKSDNVSIFDTTLGGFVYENQFLQIATKLASRNFYGLGENLHNSLRHDFSETKRWASFSRDQPPRDEDPQANLYGSQPFYMVMENSGKAHGVFFLNSNAMEFETTPAPAFVFRTIGGILDFYIILDNTPEGVIQGYHSLIGKPHMPPLWSLGFHLSRYGFKSLTHMEAAIKRTTEIGFPLDVIHLDIDHMDERKDFTIDPVKFAGLKDKVNEWKANGIRSVMILDPGIIVNETNYRPFDLGKEMDVFIKWPNKTVMPKADFEDTNSTIMIGFVWPKGKVAFPDFLKPNTSHYWKELIVEHYKTLKFDGLWIDMNEPTNFGTNELKPWNWPSSPYWSLKCPKSSKLETPPYRTLAVSKFDDPKSKKIALLSDKTLCMTAAQGGMSHYDVHNLYGYSQTLPTFKALRAATSKRGLVLTRSTYPGSGRWAGHWLGDNFARWSGLRQSIIGMLEFNWFGYPFIGADICGFFGEPSVEMCTRWMQLGAFYPFSRNHNTINTKDQDPGVYSDEVVAIMKKAMLMRYRLMPYLYSQFFRVHKYGGTVIRPLFFEFPEDSDALRIHDQFLWGSSVLISPILKEKQKTLAYYLPKGVWYRMTDSLADDNTLVNMGDYQKETEGWKNTGILTKNSSTEVHLREGHVIFTKTPRVTTKLLHKDPIFHVVVALDSNGNAAGELYWDDGEAIDDEMKKIFHGEFVCKNFSCRMVVKANNYEGMAGTKIGVVSFLGTTKEKCRVEGYSTKVESIFMNQILKCDFYNFRLIINAPFMITATNK